MQGSQNACPHRSTSGFLPFLLLLPPSSAVADEAAAALAELPACLLPPSKGADGSARSASASAAAAGPEGLAIPRDSPAGLLGLAVAL